MLNRRQEQLIKLLTEKKDWMTSRECISLQGDEVSKRRFYRELLVAEVQENFLNLNRLAHLYRHFDLIEVKDIFVKVLGAIPVFALSSPFDISLSIIIFHNGL